MKIQIPPDAGLNTQKAFRDVEQELSDINRRVSNLPRGVTQSDLDSLRAELKRLIRKPVYSTWEEVFGSFLGKHNILSVQHADTLIGTLLRGDVLRVNSTSKLERYPKGTAQWVLGSNGTDAVYLDRRIVRITSDFSTTSSSLVDVTALGFSVEANADYRFEFCVALQTSGTGTGLKLSVNGPASPTRIVFSTHIQTTTQQTFQHEGCRAYDSATLTAGVDTANADCPGTIRGILRNGANAGTLIVRLAAPGIGTARVMSGSSGWIQKLEDIVGL